MSDTPIEVVEVLDIQQDPNLTNLEIIKVLGTQFLTTKNEFKVGDHCIYFPPDMVINPNTVSPEIVKYLKKGNRIGAIRLRGVPSFGFGLKTTTAVGTNLTDKFGGKKWNPPEYIGEGFLDKPGFFVYTNIEHYYKHKKVFVGKEVIITEKIHGTNARAGVIKNEFYVGSHRRTRSNKSIYHLAFKATQDYLESCKENGFNAIVFGEIYGKKIQFMDYNTEPEFRAFDIMFNGVYLDFYDFNETCNQYKIPMVPILYRGPYYNGLVEEYTSGISFQPSTGKFKGREGIVIKSITEGRTPNLGRLILKSVSSDYYEVN